MERPALTAAMAGTRAEWEATIAELGPERLREPRVVGHWRVHDVIAHFNGWDRWQLVQLRSAFTGEVPTQEELNGSLDLPEVDQSLPFADGLNASFEAANRDRPTDDVLAEWRGLCDLRAAWVADAAQDRLDAPIGWDWNGTPGRHLRLVAEVPEAIRVTPAGQFVLDQVDHQREHLAEVRDWMAQH